MFQCNEHVEMDRFLCSLACTWMTILDSQFYIIDSLSLDISLEWNANWWLPGCKYGLYLRMLNLHIYDIASHSDIKPCIIINKPLGDD